MQVARLLGSLGQFIYSVTADDTIHVHLYIPSTFETVLSTGRRVRVTQLGGGPFQGGANLVLEGDGRHDAKVDLRIPEGAEDFEVPTWFVITGLFQVDELWALSRSF